MSKTKKSYVPSTEGSPANRAAHFLDWAAENEPMAYYEYTEIYKLCMNTPKLPLKNSRDVLALRKSGQRIKAILQKTYSRGLIYMRGIGVRASVDDFDFTKNCTSKISRRIAVASEKLKEHVDAVDVTTFPKTDEGKAWSSYVKDQKVALKDLLAPDFYNRLLPPKSTASE